MANEHILGVNITIDTIRDRIKLLSTYEGFSLEGAIAQLQTALHANPDAANLLLPAEIGAAVAAIMKVKNVIIAEASTKKVLKDAKKIDLSNADVMQTVMDDL